jgi:hypothetical protein
MLAPGICSVLDPPSVSHPARTPQDAASSILSSIESAFGGPNSSAAHDDPSSSPRGSNYTIDRDTTLETRTANSSRMTPRIDAFAPRRSRGHPDPRIAYGLDILYLHHRERRSCYRRRPGAVWGDFDSPSCPRRVGPMAPGESTPCHKIPPASRRPLNLRQS